MKENWYALCVSIVGEKSSKKALELMGIKLKSNISKGLNFTKEQALNIKFLNKTMTWNELGEINGISGEALRNQVYKTLKKTTKELGKATSVVH